MTAEEKENEEARQQISKMKAFVSANLVECCKEIAELRTTGKLLGGKTIEASELLTAKRFFYGKVSYAETEVMFQACEHVAGIPVRMHDSQFIH
jgi:hypothetical protein